MLTRHFNNLYLSFLNWCVGSDLMSQLTRDCFGLCQVSWVIVNNNIFHLLKCPIWTIKYMVSSTAWSKGTVLLPSWEEFNEHGGMEVWSRRRCSVPARCVSTRKLSLWGLFLLMTMINVSFYPHCVGSGMNGESVGCGSSHKINKVSFTQEMGKPSWITHFFVNCGLLKSFKTCCSFHK